MIHAAQMMQLCSTLRQTLYEITLFTSQRRKSVPEAIRSRQIPQTINHLPVHAYFDSLALHGASMIFGFGGGTGGEKPKLLYLTIDPSEPNGYKMNEHSNVRRIFRSVRKSYIE